MRNQLRGLLSSKEAVLGAVITLQDPAVVEIAGLAGFDFVMIEMEHVTTGDPLAYVRAARSAGLGSLARLPASDAHTILRILDGGLEGVLLAGADGLAEARAAVATCRYPPIGKRGVGTMTRSADYGGPGLTYGDLFEQGNREVVVGLLVEEPGAVEEIDEIVAIEGLDFVFIGPSDLSASMGLAGSRGHPRVVDAVERVIAACKTRGVPHGLPLSHPTYPKDASELRELGTRVILGGIDAPTLLTAFRAAVSRARPSTSASLP
jgi:4-hydroxy-2-oxoheptanedioate aldolase